MDNLKNTDFYDINLTTTFSSIEKVIKNAVESYWEIDKIKVKVNAINNFRDFREEKIISKINFFSSQVRVQNHKPVVFRLSEEFVDGILTKILNNAAKEFNLHKLTNLEVKILNNFCEFLYKKIDKILIPTEEVKITENSDKSINFVLFLSIDDDECSRIMLSIPKDRFKFEPLKKVSSFKDENFLKQHSIVKIIAGSSRITLDELKNLSNEDIILLENSNSTKLTLVSGELKKDFKVKVDSSLIFNIDVEEEKNENTRVDLSDNEVTMEKNLWDDIQIEINAEFEKVKMTIGELKQITQGQIVDLGSVFNNEISLFVEDKIVAKGELVIINDKYAVKVNKVFSPQTEAVKSQIPPKSAGIAPTAKPGIRPGVRPMPPKPAAKTPIKPPPAPKEDFDYSDFEK